MTARNLLVRGLLAGLVAGFVAFLVAHQVGEPHVERAIALEEADSGAGAHTHGDAGSGHSHDEEQTAEVSRHDQRTWGLLTGTLVVGTALGGVVALVSAAAFGRIGRLRPSQTTALLTSIGFVAFSLVPFLKYPATPPAVGSGNTIGERTGSYFAFVAISLAVAVGATLLARALLGRVGAYPAVLAGAGSYLVVMVVAALAMPTVNELGDFPADTLWYFREASLFTLAALWGTLGIVLTGLVGRLHARDVRTAERRLLAASL